MLSPLGFYQIAARKTLSPTNTDKAVKVSFHRVTGRDSLQIRFTAQGENSEPREQLQALAQQLIENPTAQQAETIVESLICNNSMTVKQKQFVLSDLTTILFTLDDNNLLAEENYLALISLSDAEEKYRDQFSVELETKKLSEQLKNDPQGNEGKSALSILIEYLQNDDYQFSKNAAEALGKAAENPEAWAIIKTPLLASAGKRDRCGTVLSAAANYKHTWPEIFNTLLAFDLESEIGKMAGQHLDIWELVKPTLFERLQDNQPSKIRKGALMAIGTALSGNSALWADVKERVIPFLSDLDTSLHRGALMTIKALASDSNLAPELLNLVNSFIQNFKTQIQPRLDELEARKDVWDDELYRLGAYHSGCMEIAQDLYAEIANHPNGWQQISASNLWKNAFFDQAGDWIITEFGAESTVKRYNQLYTAAAQYPENWDSVKKSINWGINNKNPRGLGLMVQAIQAHVNSDFLWNQVKPLLIERIQSLPQESYRPDLYGYGDYRESTLIDLIKTVVSRLKNHPEEWPDFEESIGTLWKARYEELQQTPNSSNTATILKHILEGVSPIKTLSPEFIELSKKTQVALKAREKNSKYRLAQFKRNNTIKYYKQFLAQ